MSKRRHLAWLWIIAVAGLAGGGCGGFSASRSVSPLDFFMPRLLQNAPAPAHDPTTSTNGIVPALQS